MAFRLRHGLPAPAWPSGSGMFFGLRHGLETRHVLPHALKPSARGKADGVPPAISNGLQRSVST
jgi:hypothetical protein